MTVFARGPVRVLSEVFGGKLKVDEALAPLLQAEGQDWEVKGLDFNFFQVAKGVSDDQIRSTFAVREILNRDIIFAALVQLDSKEEKRVLRIPEGDDEVDVILGYIKD